MAHTPRFTSVDDVRERLAAHGYLASDAIATTVYLADQLGKPLLVEGPAGVGKTALSAAVASATAGELVRLQCYEGVDEARALYEWNHAKQLLRITAAGAHHDPKGEDEADWSSVKEDIFTDEFLLSRPLLTAIRNEHPTVLLIDELQVTVPELGTIEASQTPFVVLTSNATRELSEALRRRCLYLHIDYPEAELEREIVGLTVPDLDEALAGSIVRLVGALREMRLRKSPSVAETIDWARTLLSLGAEGDLDPELVRSTLGVVLKHREDIELADAKLDLGRALA